MEYIVDRRHAEQSYAAHAYRQSAQTTVYTAQHTAQLARQQNAAQSTYRRPLTPVTRLMPMV